MSSGAVCILFSVVFSVMCIRCIAVQPPEIVNADSDIIELMIPNPILHGNVLSTGGEDPKVTIFWGPSDGGTNINNWAFSESMGILSTGIYSAILSGESGWEVGSNYFYRSYSSNSSGESWAPSTTSFEAKSGLTLQDFEVIEEKAIQQRLSSAIAQGDERLVCSLQEEIRFKQDQIVIDSWTNYVSAYGVEIFSPTSFVFNMTNPVSFNLSTSSNAIRTYFYSVSIHDSSNLFAMADTTGSNKLSGWGLSPTDNSVGGVDWSSDITEITLLYRASITNAGSSSNSNYETFAYRREYPDDPTNHGILISTLFLKEVSGQWFFTDDLARSEILQLHLGAAFGIDGMPMGLYNTTFRASMTNSQLPSWFYTIE